MTYQGATANHRHLVILEATCSARAVEPAADSVLGVPLVPRRLSQASSGRQPFANVEAPSPHTTILTGKGYEGR